MKTSFIAKINGLLIIISSLFLITAAFALIGYERLIPGVIGVIIGIAMFVFGYQRMFARLKIGADQIAEIKTLIPKRKVVAIENISYCQESKDYGGIQYPGFDFYSHSGEKIYTISDGFFSNACSTIQAWAEDNGIPLRNEDGTPKVIEDKKNPPNQARS